MSWFFQTITNAVSAAPPVDKAAEERARKAALRNKMREQAVAMQDNRKELVAQYQRQAVQYRQLLEQANRNEHSAPAKKAMLIKRELTATQAEIARIDRDLAKVRGLLTLAQNRERTAQMHQTMQEYAQLEQKSGTAIDRDKLDDTVRDLQDLADQERAVQRDLEQLSFDAPTDDYSFDQEFLADLNNVSAAGAEYTDDYDEILAPPPTPSTPAPRTEEERLAVQLERASRSPVTWEPPANWSK